MKHEIKNKQTVYQGFFQMHVYDIEHECFTAAQPLRIRRECLERGDAVAVLLYDKPRDLVLLIEQFRVGPAVRQQQPWMLEIVAGMLEEGEDKLACARRECIEEAGYEPQQLHDLGSFYVSPGGCSERIFLYLGEVDSQAPIGKGGGLAVEHEDIRCLWLAREQVMAAVQTGEIQAAAPLIALMRAFSVPALEKPATDSYLDAASIDNKHSQNAHASRLAP